MPLLTVLVKTGPETLDSHNFEAEFAEWSEDDKLLEFTNGSPLVYLVHIIQQAQSKPQLDNSELEDLARRFVHALSGFHVASFKTEFVAGYYQGTSVDPPGPARR